jgi:hypothetical protein
VSGCNSIAENIQRNWGTYFGGTGSESVIDVATDAAGNVFLTGTTTSNTNVATAGAHDNSYGGATDGYVAKFNPASGELIMEIPAQLPMKQTPWSPPPAQMCTLQ